MKTYNVSMPATGYFHVIVKANSPEEAIELAIELEGWELGDELEPHFSYEAEEL